MVFCKIKWQVSSKYIFKDILYIYMLAELRGELVIRLFPELCRVRRSALGRSISSPLSMETPSMGMTPSALTPVYSCECYWLFE